MRRWALAALLVCLAVVALTARADFARRVESEHFAIHYTSGNSRDAVSAGYARLVRDGLESAYAFYVASGFDMYTGRIEVHILPSEWGELGAEYDGGRPGEFSPVIEIATQAVMEETLAESFVEVSVEDLVASTAAHELFHVVQDHYANQGLADMAEASFVEAHANAVAEFAVPDANDYLDASLDLILAPDSIGFFHRAYDAAVFWVYVIDHYGMGALRDVMAASAAYEGRHAVDRAFADRGLTFLDVWSEFAIALATGGLRDEQAIEAAGFGSASGFVVGAKGSTSGSIPPPVHHATWAGQALDVSWVNVSNERQTWPFVAEDSEGTPLRVAHAYGIDVLDIVSGSDSPMQITFSGDEETEFFVAVAIQHDGGWRVERIEPGTPSIVTDSFDLARVVVTRTEVGTGTYTLQLAAP